MSTKNRKRSKGQDDRRLTLLEPVLNKFCYAKMSVGHEEHYYYLYHRLSTEDSTSKIEQIILSGNLLFDGFYVIRDYEVERAWDVKEKKWVIELYPKEYDQYVGRHGDKFITKTTNELKDYLVGAKYLTEHEFWFYCQNEQAPEEMQEIQLIFDKKDKVKKEVSEDEYI